MGLTLFLIVAVCLAALLAATFRRPRDQRPHRDRDSTAPADSSVSGGSVDTKAAR